jgi:cell wall assembly regulator SMI1
MKSTARSPEQLRKAWKKLVDTLTRKAPALAGVLAPGATEGALFDAETQLGAPLPPLVREFFRLQGGERQSEEEPIFEVAYLIPLTGVDSVMTQLERMDVASLSALVTDRCATCQGPRRQTMRTRASISPTGSRWPASATV